MISAKPRFLVAALVVIAVLVLPAAAQASSYDLAISETQSATVIEKGGLVTFTADVVNQGTRAENVYVELSSLGGHGRGADDPYLSFSTSQGTCSDQSGPAYGTVYNLIVCELGPLAPGARAQITAVVKANQSAHYFAYLLPNANEGGYQDADNSDNVVFSRVTASTPPLISGSPKIKLSGLPKGCATGDFTFTAVAKIDGVKKVSASLFYYAEGEGESWKKTANGSRLTAKVDSSRLSNELGLSYELMIKAKLGGGRHFSKSATFELC
ncbi:MAG: DUF11 domain-containing protein [Solirubrobacterales bacterium]|nr:DUF11 domain-containing protein [Solirubrobacterales bacterium]